MRRERLCDRGPRPAAGDPGDALPLDPAHAAPSMLSPRELNYLHWLASVTAGDGRVVELGCFLGGSTAALVAGRRSTGRPCDPLLVYDTFEAPPAASFAADPSLARFGLTPGGAFLDVYRRLHADRLDELEIRPGRLPEAADDAAAMSLYPEQAPIGLLFVDLAKSWGLHLTVLRAFARHVRTDGVLVQQDFGDFRTPWIPVHMYQLRHAFEPLDRVRGEPTVSFRCVRPVRNTELSALAASAGAMDHRERNRLWRGIAAYWSKILGEDASGWLAGHEAAHALHAGDGETAAACAQQYDAWRWTRDAADVHVSPAWSTWLADLPEALERRDAVDHAVHMAEDAAAVDRVRREAPGAREIFAAWKTDAMKTAVWRDVAARLGSRRVRTIALYGGGRHTRWLLESGWPREAHVKVDCIIDDTPAQDAINGTPVLRPEDAAERLRECGCGGVILPSTDAWEDAVLPRATALAESCGWSTMPAYTCGDVVRTHDDAATEVSAGATATIAPPGSVTRPSPTEVTASPAHRAQLGLSVERPWIDVLCARVGWPDWARGHINADDAAFLWDLIEATGATTVLEIGVASGVSSAAIAAGIDSLNGGTADAPLVRGFDITSTCYFDAARPVGSAVGETAPALADRVSIITPATAREAARAASPASMDLVLIDADHRHPSPALDLLMLAPVLRPGAWVVLHDLALETVQSAGGGDPGPEDGPRRLYDAWPFAKVRAMHADPARANIGAVQTPDSTHDAAVWLASWIESA